MSSEQPDWTVSTMERPAPAVLPLVASDGAAPLAQPAPERIDRYVVLRELGSGAMGVVYAAYDNLLDRKVALKLLRDSAGGSEAHRRMLREARALARLSHPNIVGIYEVGEVGPRVFLALELVDGVSLRAWLAAQQRTASEIVAVFLQAAAGLTAAHAAGLVHRDFKPDNVLIGDDGRVRVTDFGLARLFADAAEIGMTRSGPMTDPEMTAAGALLGTPAYMAPEQHLGLAAHAVADIYSFAVALYEALHGARPFEAASYQELSDVVVRGQRTHVPTRGRVQAWLQAVVSRGMALEPGDRWPTMLVFAAALRREPWVRLRRGLGVVGLLTALLGLGFVLPPAWHDMQLRRARAQVEALAEARLQAVELLQQGGDAAGAEVALVAFLAAEEHRGTRALARASLRRGQVAWSEGQVDAALDAMARAYVEASTPEAIVAAMRAISEVYHARWQLAELAPVLAELAEHDAAADPATLRMRFDVALDRDDFAAALTAIDEPAAPLELVAQRGLLTTLARARPLGLRAEHIEAVTTAAGPGFVLSSEHGTQLTLTDAALRPRATHTVSGGVLELVAGTPAYFAADRGVTTLFAWDGDAVTPLWRCPSPGDLQPRTAAWLDLGDGGAFYFGAQWQWRGFRALRPASGGGWTLGPAHAATDAGASDLGALLASDLDGDGQPELVVGTGAWNQLDLRVFRARAGALELADLRVPGRITGLAMVHGDHAPRLAALKDDRYAPFPTPPHTGEPAGVYLYEWGDGQLRDVGHLPLPRRGELAALPIAEGMLACDLDGDARTDLVAALTAGMGGSERERGPHAAVFHQRPDGGFDRFILGVHPFVCTRLAGEDHDVLVARGVGSDDFALWALGTGDLEIPPRSDTTPSAGPAPASDPLLVDRWARAGRLIASGLTAPAVRLLRDTAKLTSDARVEQTLLVRAGGLLQDHDETRAAVGLYDHAARRLALPGPVALRAAEAHVGLGEVDVADRLLRDLAAAVVADRATRATAAARLQVLAPLVHRSVALRFDVPLDPSWTLDPLVLGRDARAQALRIDTATGAPELASLPLTWEGGAAALTVDLTIDHLERASDLEFALVDADGHTIVSVGVFAPVGFPQQQWMSCHDPSQPVSAKFAVVPTTTSARRTIRARAVWDPARGVVTCDAEVDATAGRFISRPSPALARAGAVRLVIRASEQPLAHLSARLHAMTLHGVELASRATVEPGPRQRAAHQLVEGRPAEALQALGVGTDMPLWRFLAYDRLREPAAATAALRVYLAAEPDAGDLLRLLRLAPDRVGPPLRDILGAGVHQHVTAALFHAFRHHPLEAWVHDLLLVEFPWQDDLDSVDPETRVTSLLMHALALAASGRHDEARIATRRALAAVDDASPSPSRPLDGIWQNLAALLATAAPEEAIAAVREGIRMSPAPETTRARVRTLPAFNILAAEPAWLEVVGPVQR